MFGYLGAAASQVGPRQQACLAAGGSWAGPVGQKKCIGGVAAGPLTIQAGSIQAAGATPKPGSTVTGPIPPEYIGTEKAPGTLAGPKQLACAKNGGHWIGPEGRRWCQMVPGVAVPAVASAAPSPVAAAPSPVSTASIPPGAELSSQLPTTGEDSWTPEMSMAPGLQTGATGAPGTTSTFIGPLPSTGYSRFAMPGAAIAGAALLGWFLLRRKRGGRGGRGSRRSGARGTRRSYRSKSRSRRASKRYGRASARRR